MNRWIRAALVVTTLAALGCATGQTAARDDAASVEEDRPFSSSEGGFSIAFPEEPRLSKQEQETRIGTISTHSFAYTPSDPTRQESYNVVFVDYPAEVAARLDPAKAVESAAQQAFAQEEATIVSADDITIEGYPGKALVVRSPTREVLARFYQVGPRLYQLTVAYPHDAAPADAEQFLESFEIDPEALRRLTRVPEEGEHPVSRDGFSVIFPGEPDEDIGSLGEGVETLTYSHPASEYSLSWSDYGSAQVQSEKPQTLLERARDAAVSEVDGKLESEEDATLGKHPGKKLEISIGDEAHITMHLFLVDDRMYALAASYLPGQPPEGMQAFFDSFRVTGAKEQPAAPEASEAGTDS